MRQLLTEENQQTEHSLEKSMSLVASAMSDPSRVAILCALMDGRAWTATELGAVVSVAASTTSGHLARLLSSGLIVCLTQGRHRYYSLAGHHIAGLLENLMGVSMRPRAASPSRTPGHLRYARTCYDHLAGELAVKIYGFMLQKKWLQPEGSSLTAVGKAQFDALGAILHPESRRKACCACLDWSERRFHLGGDAGHALMTRFLQKGWLVRVPGYREVNVTTEGARAMRQLFRIDPP